MNLNVGERFSERMIEIIEKSKEGKGRRAWVLKY
jgi:hypothetical protein